MNFLKTCTAIDEICWTIDHLGFGKESIFSIKFTNYENSREIKIFLQEKEAWESFKEYSEKNMKIAGRKIKSMGIFKDNRKLRKNVKMIKLLFDENDTDEKLEVVIEAQFLPAKEE